ncbi:alpha/beta hydrolase [Actinomadura soli]|uniref:Alpha/beta hydrolase n=1 Tax=Actinomadura soli TaxID=2508997 RepID=A0A5C4J8X6_9ACTN|nr:alpha/beta fold hydrolase [Actinomadura soli]TMQ95565.1 alpha/beta hydrolase [Actinomadura soli]
MSRATRRTAWTLTAAVAAGAMMITPALAAPVRTATATTTGGNASDPTASDPTATSRNTSGGKALGQPFGRIEWRACTETEFQGMRCGTMRVPVDWSEPGGARLELALVRRPADDQARRVGTLMLNNGVGRSAIEQLRLAMRTGLPRIAGDMTKRFDLVALDPRGVGRSTPIRCAEPLRPAGVSYFPKDRQAFQTLVTHNRALARGCIRQNGDLMANVDITSVARDFEAVREGLGERQLNWYGILYSNLLGRTYADLFPGRLRTMFLDTALDDTGSPLRRIFNEAAAAEQSFNRFAAWCTGSPDCVLRGRDVAAEYDTLVARADRSPIPVAGGAHRPLTGEDIRVATQEFMNVSFIQWPALAKAIAKAQAGDASEFTRNPDRTLDLVQAQVPTCLDTSRPVRTFQQVAQVRKRLAEISPHLGGAVSSWNRYAGCIGWPIDAKPVHSGGKVWGAPPALVVQSTHQALALHSEGRALASQLPGSVVLSREGDDYSMFLVSQCVRDAGNRYLIDRALPKPGTVCTN